LPRAGRAPERRGQSRGLDLPSASYKRRTPASDAGAAMSEFAVRKRATRWARAHPGSAVLPRAGSRWRMSGITRPGMRGSGLPGASAKRRSSRSRSRAVGLPGRAPAAPDRRFSCTRTARSGAQNSVSRRPNDTEAPSGALVRRLATVSATLRESFVVAQSAHAESGLELAQNLGDATEFSSVPYGTKSIEVCRRAPWPVRQLPTITIPPGGRQDSDNVLGVELANSSAGTLLC
jgi:hypothetical protein